MALQQSFEFLHRYNVTYDGATDTVTITSQASNLVGGNPTVRVITESTDGNSVVNPGEQVTLSFGGSPSSTVYYIGRIENVGMVVGFQDEGVFTSYVLLSDDNGLTGNFSVDKTMVFCLLAGTLIPTSDGEKFVEELSPGDLVLNSQGSYSPLRWVGVQTLSPIFSGKDSWPVKISKDALGENTPDKDLYVSQDHAIFLHGALICAEALVNGTTITLEEPTESAIKYYGLDLGPATIHPVHNLPVGSLGATAREHFDNYQEWLDSGLEIIDEPLMFPRIKNASQLPAQLREEISA